MWSRLYQSLLILSTLALSWFAMMAVHEFGHVLHAWVSGGDVQRVFLHPLSISYTTYEHNPHPHFVAWGGVICGSLIPLGVFLAGRLFRWSLSYLLRFFAGFCLIANGAYLTSGLLLPVGDTRELIQYGTPIWILPIVGVPSVASGLWCWHGLGQYFGLGMAKGKVDRRAVLAVAPLAAAILIIAVFS